MSAGWRTRRRVALWAAALVVLVYGVVCWVVSGMLLTPERRLPRVDGVALNGFAIEDVELTTEDGLRLAGWVLEPADGVEVHGTVLIFHGKDGCRQASRLVFAAERGFRSLAVDSRAHGASEGQWTTFGWDERKDVAAAWCYARERWGDDGPLIAWGTSQGAAAVVYFAEEFAAELGADVAGVVAGVDPLQPRPVDGLILESLYVDVDTAFRNRLVRRLGGWALPWAWPVRELVSMRSGIDPRRLAPASSLRRLTARSGLDDAGALAEVPILLAAGMADAYATPAEAEILREATGPGQAVLVLVPERGHEDLLAGGGTVYSTAVDGFLARFRQ